jgi:hypothetical protein
VVGSLLSFAPLSSAQDAAPSVALTSPQVGVFGTRLRAAKKMRNKDCLPRLVSPQ